MTDLLKPPPEHDLPPSRSADIRRVVMQSVVDARRRRTGRRAWLLVPAVAALAVVGVVVGVRPDQAPSVLGSPGPAPSLSASPHLSRDEVETDAGPLSHADAVAIVEKLREDASKFGAGAVPTYAAPLADVVLARRTTTPLGDGTYVVWTDTNGATWYYVAVPNVMGESGPVSGPAVRHPKTPDTDHPVVGTVDDLDRNFSWHEDADRPDATARDLYSANFYLVSDSVDRVEVRMTVEGRPGPWYTAPAHNGYVYVPAVARGPHSTSDHIDKVTHIEDRAFDHDGNLVPITER
ncbi:MAG: hypothetical protein ACRYG2_22700 [Janthinobacterium lividum]